MIIITSEKDRKQLKSNLLKTIRKGDYTALRAFVCDLKCDKLRIAKINLENFSYIAARKGDMEVIRFLLKYNANIYIIFKILAEHGHLNALKQLQAEYDINLNENKTQASLALVVATLNSHTDVVKYLYEQGARSKEIMQRAIEKNAIDIVKYLIGKGENITYNFNQALSTASRMGCFEIVKLLVENGANPNALNGYASKIASINGHLSVVEYIEKL